MNLGPWVLTCVSSTTEVIFLGEGRSSQPANDVAAEIVAGGGRARAHVVDVSSWSECEDLVNFLVADAGRLDIVVNAAGNFVRDTVTTATPVTRDRIRTVHYDGALNLASCAGRHWDSESAYGRFVQFTSDAAMTGVSDTFSYGAATAAGLGLVRSAAAYFRGTNVTFNGVTQDSRTRMKAAYHGGSELPTDRLNDPATVAPLIVHLVSTASQASSGRIFGAYGDRYVRWSDPVHELSIGGHGSPIITGGIVFERLAHLHVKGAPGE